MTEKTSDVREVIQGIADQLHEELRARGDVTRDEFCRALRDAIRPLEDELARMWVYEIADEVDREVTSGPCPQVLRLDADRRIDRRFATPEQIAVAAAYQDAHPTGE